MKTVVAILIAMLLAGPTASLDQRELIEKALDEPTRITLEDVKIGQAFAMVTEQTGVEIVMRPEVMAMIPYGAETTVNATIAGTTLRQGLTDLFGRLGMTIMVTDRNVEVIPKASLLCLERPATWDELDTLHALSTTQPGADRDQLTALRDKLQFQVQMQNPWDVLSVAIRNVGTGPGDEVLTVACDNLGWAWCVSGKSITILSAEQKVRRQLQIPVELRVSNRPLIDVLQEIGRRVRLNVRLEPGTLEFVPPDVRDNFSVNVNFLPAEQVLEAIAGKAGLGYLLDNEGVVFYRPLVSTAGPVTTTSSSDPVVGFIEVPVADGRKIQWMLRRSECPAEILELRGKHLDEAFQILLQGN